MLATLRIRRLAVLDEATIEFGPGLNVISGETGAGKTLVMNALALITGARASAEMVRPDSHEAVVEALFDLEGVRLAPELAQSLELEDTRELLIRRVIAEGGRSRATVNGALATMQTLARLGANLIQIFGQHEQHELLRSESHLAILDRYAELADELEHYRGLYERALKLKAQLEKIRQAAQERSKRLELLRFQLSELSAANLTPDEDQEIAQKREFLANATRLNAAASDVEHLLYSGESAVVDALGRAQARLKEVAALDPALREPLALLESAEASVSEAARWLRTYAERAEADPAQLEMLETRLEQLNRIKRKYGGSIESALETLAQVEREIAELDDSEHMEASLASEYEAVLAKTAQAAKELSQRRQAAATDLKAKVESELKTLGIRNPVFVPRLSRLPAHATSLSCDGLGLGPEGSDDVEFNIAFNLGQPPMPLAKVASGGELSRVMLAIKCLEARRRSVATLIFDEVDAGIGGAVAEVVGLKLKSLARFHQILCVTHLAQIAAFADKHFVVEKRERRGTTISTVSELKGAERVEELARMIGGRQRSERIVRAAQELLERARA